MTDIVEISTILEESGLSTVGTIVANPSVLKGYFVPLLLTQRPDGRKLPSGATLATTKQTLKQLGFTIDFILVDEKTRDVETSLRSSLLSSFPDDVRNSFYSSTTAKPQAWVEFKRHPNAEAKLRIEQHLQKFADLFSLPNLSLMQIGEANTATKLEVLSIVRQLAPVDLPTLTRGLIALGHDVPSSDWTNRRLDALRKNGLVLRRQDGSYVLTTEALSQLGTRKGRKSPDVRRFLALARRVQ